MVRRLHASFLLLTLLSVSACSCDTGPTTQARGVFQLRDGSVDFGTACIGATSERTITVANIGNAPLVIESIDFQGEAFALLDELPEYIARGDEVVLRLGFTPDVDRDFTGAVTITTDSLSDSTQSATLIGTGFSGKEQDIRFTCEGAPGNGTCFFIQWGDVLVGESSERSVEMTNHGCRDVNVNEAFFEAAGDTGHEAFFSFPEQKAPFRVRGGETIPLTLRFTAPSDETQAQATLVLKTDDPEVKDVRWPAGEWRVTAWASAVKPNLQTDTDLLTFYEGAEGVPLRKTFRVINGGSSPLEVRNVTLVHEEGRQDYALELPDGATRFTLPPFGAGTNEREITVVYTSTGSGSARARVEIDADPETATVRLVGGTEPNLVVTWMDPEDSQWKMPPIHFGTTATGATGIERTVRLSNTGRADLDVSAVQLGESSQVERSFVVPAYSGRIAPESSAEFVVTFNDAVQIRNDADKLEVVSNDPLYAQAGGVYEADLLSVNEPNFRPVVRIVAPGSAETHRELLLDGSTSSGPEENDTLTFEWTVVTQPNGANAELESPNGVTTRVFSRPADPSQVCPPGPVCDWLFQPGTYNFRLRVTDQFGNFAETTQQVMVFGQ